MGKSLIIILCVLVAILSFLIILSEIYVVKFNTKGAIVWINEKTGNNGIKVYIGKYYLKFSDTTKASSAEATEKERFIIGRKIKVK